MGRWDVYSVVEKEGRREGRRERVSKVASANSRNFATYFLVEKIWLRAVFLLCATFLVRGIESLVN